MQEAALGTVVTYDGKTKKLVLVSKWGCDGSTGHSQYKQKASSENLSDNDLFLSSVVPLPLHLEKDSNTILWQNPRPSSPRLCRPIRFQFKKENLELANTYFHYIESQIRMILPTEVTVLGCRVNVRHELLLTMIDGKIISAALLPIGQLSEEAQEARNKDLKKCRESFARKISKEETNKDLMRRLLVYNGSSDFGHEVPSKSEEKNADA